MVVLELKNIPLCMSESQTESKVQVTREKASQLRISGLPE